MAMSNKDVIDLQLRRSFNREYEKTVSEATHFQINESQQPMVIKPFDLRDD